MSKVLIFWEGLPACSALINSLAISPDYQVDLLYTKPSVPFTNISAYLDGLNSINSIECDTDIPSPSTLAKYNLVIVTGWSYHQWNQKLRRAKKINSSLVVASSVDNIKAISMGHKIRQFFGQFYYRFYLRRIFDYCFVPGSSSFELMKSFGHPSSKIFHGYYGASTAIYYSTNKITNRPKSFLFVGQIIQRKGIDVLIKAFEIYQSNGGTYTLTIVGSTKKNNDQKILGIKHSKSIQLLPFLQPDQIANLMNLHRVLIAPSRYDHWATVVCEAAACGCLLVASQQVGASYDIIRNGINGFIFDCHKEGSEYNLARILHQLETILASNSAEERSLISQRVSLSWSEDQYRLAVEAMLK